jgi:predicted AAA+ superfamily ATPase
MEDRGALLENLVYMHLRRQGMVPEYYITQTGSEVDFVVLPDDGGERQLIQVCWDLNQPHTRQREVAALLSAMDELQVQRGSIVTWLDTDTSDGRLTIVPAWQWLLEA